MSSRVVEICATPTSNSTIFAKEVLWLRCLRRALLICSGQDTTGYGAVINVLRPHFLEAIQMTVLCVRVVRNCFRMGCAFLTDDWRELWFISFESVQVINKLATAFIRYVLNHFDEVLIKSLFFELERVYSQSDGVGCRKVGLVVERRHNFARRHHIAGLVYFSIPL